MNQYSLLLIKLFVLMLTNILCNLNSLAYKDKFFINKLNRCKVSRVELNNYEPAEFASTNNLLRNSGLQRIYCGDKIIIVGKVLDQNCVPISDAKVYLWQVGCDGKYPYKPMRKNLNRNLLNIDNNSSFTGSGIATTNNLGEFYFVTVRPLAKHGSYVNVRVAHRDLGELQTKLNLIKANILDEDFEISQLVQQAIHDEDAYKFNIVLPGYTNKAY